MNCELVHRYLFLYYYGELAPEQEEQVDEHIHICADCARDMEGQRALAAALDRRQADPPPELLPECRAELLAALDVPAAPRPSVRPGAWRLFLSALAESAAGMSRWRRPIGAVALVALGFFGARLGMRGPQPGPAALAPSDQVFASIRSVQPDAIGGVQISFDETRRRVVSGSVNDSRIQQLLLAAVREDNNAAVRVESVDLLKMRPGSNDVRMALLNAVAHDPNAGVRLKALDGLRPLAADPEVRKTLAQVLVSDDSPAVRIQVVDLLVQHRDGSMIGVLQDMVQKDSDNYVRLKCEKALKDLNASVGTF